ncbi:MAG TPA: nucleotidyltransferase family protein, partial [Thalassobaculum sp.]
VYGAAWNRLSGRPPGENVKDYDVFYWDEDTAWEAEDAVIRRAAALFADLRVPVELKNQKRVPIWYREKFGVDYRPVGCAADAIARFQVACTCVGLAPRPAGGVELCAPHGLDELFAGILRPNRQCPSRPELIHAKAESYRARWPWLRIVG